MVLSAADRPIKAIIVALGTDSSNRDCVFVRHSVLAWKDL
jgi:hypothetical protein